MKEPHNYWSKLQGVKDYTINPYVYNIEFHVDDNGVPCYTINFFEDIDDTS